MEKKKLLLVTISVGVFLVIVIGASILVFSPRNPAPAVMAAVSERPIPAGIQGTLQAVSPGIAGSPVTVDTPQETDTALQVQPATADPTDMVRNPDGFQSLQTPPSSISAVQENRFYINNDTTQPVLIERKDGDSTRVVINVPRPTTAAVPNAQAASQPSASASAATSAPAARTASGSAATRSTAAPGSSTPRQTAAAAPARTVAAPARSAPQTPQSRTYNAYWVQTGSFPTRNQADKAKEILAAKGLTAVIENGDVRGETWYRVRVGPYTSQNEADYWLSLIKSINGKPHIDLASSIVWMSNTR